MQAVVLIFGPEKVTSSKMVEEEEGEGEGEGEEPVGEGTSSTELSDIRLQGRCGRRREKQHVPHTDRQRMVTNILY